MTLMNRETKVSKNFVIKLIIGIWIALCATLILSALGDNIKRMFNNIFPPRAVSQINLTQEEKIEDFEYFYNTLIESMPMIREYSDVYGFNIEDKKQYYEQLIKATTSDYEFYCVMAAFSQEIPSFHTDLVYPDSIRTMQCYNADNVSTDREIISYNNYWINVIEEETNIPREYFVFSYVDGKYVYNSLESSVFDAYERMQLLEIEGIPIDNYITEKISVYNLYFDGGNDKPCRTKIVFNDSEGELVEVKLKTEDGMIITEEIYYSLYAESTFLHSAVSDAEYPDYLVYEGNNYSYIAINNMANSYGEEISTQIQNLKSDNVIIDLRENYGGNTEYAAEYIYPHLFSTDIAESNYWYMPYSDANAVVFDNWTNKLILKFEETGNSPYGNANVMLRSEVEQHYGGEAENDRNVIILTSQRTGSAADRFASDLQNNGLAQIVGNNTGGEGRMYSYCAMNLPNSKLVFIYMPGGARNADGSDNSVCGTKADIYVNLSVEDYFAHNDALYNSEDIISYEEQLKYDTVLKMAIEILVET